MLKYILASICLLSFGSTKALDEITLKIEGEINEMVALNVQGVLAQKQPGQQLRVFINSPGGEVFAGLNIIRQIRDVGGAICEVQDLAASMAFIIFESSACTERYVEPASILMTHSGQTMAQGSSSDLKKAAKIMDTIDAAIAEIVAPNLSLSVEAYLDMVRNADVWLTGSQAVSKGWAKKK